MIKEYIKGNLLDHKGPIAHGCNAQGAMNSGVAKAIRDKYPLVYSRYKDQESLGVQGLYLGCTIPVYDYDKLIINCITQKYYGRDPTIRYVSYEAISECFSNINRVYDWYLVNFENKNIIPDRTVPLKKPTRLPLGIPKIGAGLGNGNWDIIEQLINEVTPDLDIWVYEL